MRRGQWSRQHALKAILRLHGRGRVLCQLDTQPTSSSKRNRSREAVAVRGLLPLHYVPEAGVHELSDCTANLQVGPGIFAGIHQVTGARCPYAYCHLW